MWRLMLVGMVMSFILAELYAASVESRSSGVGRNKRSSSYGSRVYVRPSERTKSNVAATVRGNRRSNVSNSRRTRPNRDFRSRTIQQSSEESNDDAAANAGRRGQSGPRPSWNVVERKRSGGRKQIRGSRVASSGRRQRVKINNPKDFNELAEIANSGANNYVDFETRQQPDGSVKRTVVRRIGTRVGTPFVMQSDCTGKIICIRRRVFPNRG